jgi:hypothetical protein
MNTTTETKTFAGTPSCKSLVDTIVDLGTSWAAFGLKIGKSALVTSAQTLGKTAETLDTLAAAFEKKAAAAKAEAAPAEGEAKSDSQSEGPPAAPSPAA